MTNQLPITFAIPNTAGNKAYSDYKPDYRILTPQDPLLKLSQKLLCNIIAVWLTFPPNVNDLRIRSDYCIQQVFIDNTLPVA